MKHLNSILSILILITYTAKGQDTDVASKLKNFEGIWKFIPPNDSNDTTFISFEFIKYSQRITTFYRKKNKSLHLLGPYIIGFQPKKKEIHRLSDLTNEGQRMYFFQPNPNAPNDSIKYFQESSPSCFASFNGLGTDWIDPPAKGEPNFFIYNFNGRDNELYVQIDHLPNYILTALANKKDDLEKVENFLHKNYGITKNVKVRIFSNPSHPTNIYLIKGDPIEIVRKKDNWLRIKYYPEKNNIWTGGIIEGWIKQSDVE